MKIQILKQYELLLALHILYLKNNPDMEDEFDFIEIPNISFVDEIIDELSKYDCSELFKYIENFNASEIPVEIAIGLDDNFEINQTKMKIEYINNNMNYGSLSEFVQLLKEFSIKVNWNNIYNRNKNVYDKLINDFNELNYSSFVSDINNFYGTSNIEYNYIISIFMNGGFGVSDKDGNLYYIKGFKYNIDNKEFEYDIPFIIECMFHEFSHPNVNPLVDNYYEQFNIEELYKEAIQNNFPKCYQNKKTFLYEYFVRACANTLVNNYYPNTKIEDWIINLGFIHLQELSDYIYNNYKKYDKFENLFTFKLIEYFNNLNKNIKKNKNVI